MKVERQKTALFRFEANDTVFLEGFRTNGQDPRTLPTRQYNRYFGQLSDMEFQLYVLKDEAEAAAEDLPEDLGQWRKAKEQEKREQHKRFFQLLMVNINTVLEAAREMDMEYYSIYLQSDADRYKEWEQIERRNKRQGMFWRMLLVLPSWMIVGLALPFFPKNHEWKGRRFSLRNWAECSTDLNDQFSGLFWLCLIFFAAMTWILITRT